MRLKNVLRSSCLRYLTSSLLAWQRPIASWSCGVIMQAGTKSTGRIRRLAALEECNSCGKAVARVRLRTEWEENKTNSLTKKTKASGIRAFPALEYTETSVGAHDENPIKEDLFAIKHTNKMEC